jgi:hypothetical protein
LQRTSTVKSDQSDQAKATMLDLLAFLLAHGSVIRNEDELYEYAVALINTRRVVLTGNFSKAETPLK